MYNLHKTRHYSITMLLPGLVIYLLLFIVPVIMSVFYSFTYWDFRTARFAGLDNYISIFTSPDMNIAFKNTFIFTIVNALFQCSLGLILAIFLNRKFLMGNFYRGIFFMPVVLNTVAVGIIFSAIMNPDYGMINNFLRVIGLGFLAKNWLADMHIVIYSATFINIWKGTGFSMILFLAGLQTVPKEFYEASYIDGASNLQKFKNITFPMIIPAFNNVLLLNIIGGLKVFDIIKATTNGGPGNASQVFNTIIFNSFGMGLYGEASAGNTILSFFVLIIVLITYSFIRKKEVEL